jgi:hypothetical protein
LKPCPSFGHSFKHKKQRPPAEMLEIRRKG